MEWLLNWTTRKFMIGLTWIGGIKMLVLGGSVSVMVNGEESSTFKTGRVLGRGILYPPFI
jgi:hypothetical protein